MTTRANAGLYCALYWGTTLAEAWSFGPEQPQVVAAPDEAAPLPLYGFTLPEAGFVLAERTEAGYRVYVPPAARVERGQHRDVPRALDSAQLPRHEGRACVELTEGVTLYLREGELTLRVEPSVARDRVARHRVRDLAWLAVVTLLFLSAPVGFLVAGPSAQGIAAAQARGLAAARQKEDARRRELGVDTPPRPRKETEQGRAPQDGGTPLPVPAHFNVR